MCIPPQGPPQREIFSPLPEEERPSVLHHHQTECRGCLVCSVCWDTDRRSCRGLLRALFRRILRLRISPQPPFRGGAPASWAGEGARGFPPPFRFVSLPSDRSRPSTSIALGGGARHVNACDSNATRARKQRPYSPAPPALRAPCCSSRRFFLFLLSLW
jgi:hypothetical protein